MWLRSAGYRHTWIIVLHMWRYMWRILEIFTYVPSKCWLETYVNTSVIYVKCHRYEYWLFVYDRFHWKGYTLEIHQIVKLWFFGTNSHQTNISIWTCTCDRFHWKGYTLEINHIVKLWFLGTNSHKTSISIWTCTARCLGIWVSRFGRLSGGIWVSPFGRFWGCRILGWGNSMRKLISD